MQMSSSIHWDSSVAIGGNMSAKTQRGLKALLSRPWRVEDEMVKFDVKNAKGSQSVVASCEALFRADSDGMRPHVYRDLKDYRSWAFGCYAVRAVSEASIARKSFVSDFSFDLSRVKNLPVELASVTSKDDVRKVKAIQARRGSLGDYLENASVKLEKGTPARGVGIQDGSGGSQGIHWMASGDFNHDGVEDLLISTYSTVSGGDYATYGLYLVSRDGLGAPLTLLKVYPVMGPGISDNSVLTR